MDQPPCDEPDRPIWSLTRMAEAFALVDAWVASGEVPGLSVCVGQAGATVEKVAGRVGVGAQTKPIGPDALFLAASLTKPVVAAAVMKLVERGWITLDDPVASILPAFVGEGKEAVRVRHLLTHTSGLPDMLPDNDALRAQNEPNATFVAGACAQPLLFPPGTKTVYSSMGFALLGAIVADLTETPLPEALAAEIFRPLGMADTTLGATPDRQKRVVRVRLDPASERTQHHWNTPYWLGLGSAWGGLITTAADYGKFVRSALSCGTADGVRLLGPASARLMTTNQTATFPGIDADSHRLRPWGLGWRLAWPGNIGLFWRFSGTTELRPLGGDRNRGLGGPRPRRLRGPALELAAGKRGGLSGPALQRHRLGSGLSRVQPEGRRLPLASGRAVNGSSGQACLG